MRLSLNHKVVVCLLLSLTYAVVAKEKKPVLMPDVVRAQSALVIIDPQAGVEATDPNANSQARKNVEQALFNWGRLTMAADVSTADLVIVIRKGSGKLVRPTIGGVPDNGRPVVFEPSDSGVRIGGRSGKPPMQGDPTQQQRSSPTPQVEAGMKDDLFTVYLGKRDDVLDSVPAWRYGAKDGLKAQKSGLVPAVDEFRKAIAEAEKP